MSTTTTACLLPFYVTTTDTEYLIMAFTPRDAEARVGQCGEVVAGSARAL